MAPPGTPEEQRFDFGLSASPPARRSSPRRRSAPSTAAASAVAAGTTRRVDQVELASHERSAVDDGEVAPVVDALQRRLAEVAAVAHGERSVGADRGEGDGPTGINRLGTVPPDGDTSADGESEESLSVAQFYERVKRALARAFTDEIWVTGEIRGFREARGHRYIELADEGAGSIGRGAAQQLEVVCWAREWPPVAAALAEAGVDLEVGRVVRVRGKVSVWEGGSKLRFTLTALDVEALLGGIAAARHRLLQTLAVEGLLTANAQLGIPLVPLRIGLVTSPGSEAHRDFVGQLERSSFRFEVLLEPSLVQGPEAPRQISAAIGRLAAAAPDLTVVVRGGGARGDLAAFDSEEVARAVATAPFPVWTGIGHTGDRSVADEVAQRALITPTACGEAVVAAVADYWEQTERRARVLSGLARARLDGALQRLHGAAGAVTRGTRHQLDRRSDELAGARSRAARGATDRVARESARLRATGDGIASIGRRGIAAAEHDLDAHRQVLRAYDPQRQMERGWSLTRDAAGVLVRSAARLESGSEITTRFADGVVRSVVSAAAALPDEAGTPRRAASSRVESKPTRQRRGA